MGCLVALLILLLLIMFLLLCLYLWKPDIVSYWAPHANEAVSLGDQNSGGTGESVSADNAVTKTTDVITDPVPQDTDRALNDTTSNPPSQSTGSDSAEAATYPDLQENVHVSDDVATGPASQENDHAPVEVATGQVSQENGHVPAEAAAIGPALNENGHTSAGAISGATSGITGSASNDEKPGTSPYPGRKVFDFVVRKIGRDTEGNTEVEFRIRGEDSNLSNCSSKGILTRNDTIGADEYVVKGGLSGPDCNGVATSMPKKIVCYDRDAPFCEINQTEQDFSAERDQKVFLQYLKLNKEQQ